MYKSLPEDFSYPSLESEVLSFWESNDIFAKSLEHRKDAKPFSFNEGPPTANGRPGIHHAIGRTLKDMICRYRTMDGYKVMRKAGWDTHGLPVEIAVEKELNLTQKNQIEEFGIDKFNAACREFIERNIEQDGGWRTLTERLGYWLDLDNPYVTCTNEYIESVWWAISEFFRKGLIYKGYRIVPQSPTIETPLSSHELSLGYKDVRDPNCYVKLKVVSSPVKDIEDAELLVWTTTPWTLVSNVALAVGEDIQYVKVRNTRTVKRGDEKVEESFLLVLAESRVSALDGESEILATFTGKELVGTRYEQVFPYMDLHIDEHPNALSIVLGEFVTTDNGSGIVHMAPAFGADDFEMAKRYNLPVVKPVTPGGRFTEGVGEFSGRTVKTFEYPDRVEEGVDKDIVIALKHAGKIYRTANDYLHSYPHCWRTGNPIIYIARDSWFIKSPEYGQEMIDGNATIKWQPSEIGSGRFGNWLEDVKEWSLSRDRYWGTPLPIWVSEDGEDMFAVGSIAELKQGVYAKNGQETPVAELDEDKIDLHRPFVDDVVFHKNGKTYRRTHEIIDVWFDSGSMPFAQYHYPFENKEVFEQAFPADFIAEGIDQTRGWFYTLHNISTVLFGKPAFKSVIVNELILDKNGQKMSKSKGNTVDPFMVMDKYGADAVRWYSLVNNPPWKPTLFNEEDIRNTVLADFFRSLTNVYSFFTLYANIDGFDGSQDTVPVSERPEIDRWIISRFNSLVGEFRDQMEHHEVTRASRAIQEFAINEMSNWYVRRNRRRFWKGEIDADKIAAYQTLRDVFLGVCKLMAPAAPFLPEYLYQRLRLDGDPVSIHLCDLPTVQPDLVDIDLERRMSTAQTIVFLARSLREKSKIKTRQPLRRILVPVNSPQNRRDITAVEDIIKEEINVKEVEYISADNDIIRKTVKANFKVIGKKFGKDTKTVAGLIGALPADAIQRLDAGESVSASAGEASFEISPEDVIVLNADIEGWLVASDKGVTVALDTELTPELRHEGIAREFVNRVQNARKDNGFEVTDRIRLQYSTSTDIHEAISSQHDWICDETLAVRLERVENVENPTHLDIEGVPVVLDISKI